MQYPTWDNLSLQEVAALMCSIKLLFPQAGNQGLPNMASDTKGNLPILNFTSDLYKHSIPEQYPIVLRGSDWVTWAISYEQ